MHAWLRRLMKTPPEPEPASSYLAIRYQPGYTLCNLSCPYCITKDFRKGRNLFRKQDFQAILSRIEELPRTVCLHLGIEGEIFTSPEMLDEVKRVCNTSNNLIGVSFLSNIHADWEKVITPFLTSVNTQKLGMGCTLHDLVIGDVNPFFDKVRKIKDCGVLVYVTYVAIPGRLPQIREYKQRCDDMGVPLILNALIGQVAGIEGVDPRKRYPRDYSADEVRQLKGLWDTPHSYKMLLDACSPKGMPCAAGREFIYIDHQGNVLPCRRIKKRMGNIIQEDIRFRAKDMVCPCDRCWCGNQNQALRIVDKYYERTRNMRVLYPKAGIPQETLYQGYNPSIFR